MIYGINRAVGEMKMGMRNSFERVKGNLGEIRESIVRLEEKFD